MLVMPEYLGYGEQRLLVPCLIKPVLLEAYSPVLTEVHETLLSVALHPRLPLYLFVENCGQVSLDLELYICKAWNPLPALVQA